jgi:uncharacterized protein (DUF2062 family)
VTRKLKRLIHEQLVQGCTPEALALTFSLAIVMGIFPLLGVTTLILVGFGILFKLNQPLLQTINYSMTPVHLIMLPVFYSAGQKFSTAEAPSLDPRIFIKEFFNNIPLFISKYGKAGLLAILVWAIVAPFLGLLIYFFCRFSFVKIKKQLEKLS